MTLEKHPEPGCHEYRVYCDGCDDFLDLVEDFDGSIALIEEEGWKIQKTDRWEHFCPECQK
jgi:hypothetical protein